MALKKHFFILVLALFIFGCGVPFVPKSLDAPPIKHCFETVGHIEGAGPFIFGGTCVGTPSEAVLADYKKYGHVEENYTLDQLIGEYQSRGIITALDQQNTNNIDEGGKHLVFGGKSMVPPTPGTQNYEDVLFGKETKWKASGSYLRRVQDEKKKRK